jgi:hypothetical protein
MTPGDLMFRPATAADFEAHADEDRRAS